VQKEEAAHASTLFLHLSLAHTTHTLFSHLR